MNYLAGKIFEFRIHKNDPVKRFLLYEYKTLRYDEPFKRLTRAFKNHTFVLVKCDNRGYLIIEPEDLTQFFLDKCYEV